MQSELTADQEMLLGFSRGAQQLVELVQPLSADALGYRLGPEEWSIRQIVHHLVEDCDVYSFVIKKALVTPGVRCHFGDFPGNMQWSAGLHNDQREIESALNLIQAQHVYLISLARHFAGAWDQGIIIYDDAQEKEIVTVSIRMIIRMLTDHMVNHICQIRVIIEQCEPEIQPEELSKLT